MKTLQVTNGDLALDTGGRLQFLVGSSKLTQDIALWLQEDFGIGFTTPNFGSILESLIGTGITSGSVSTIQAEVARIISLYRAQQVQTLQSIQQSSQLSNYNKSEIIQSVSDITVAQGTGYISVLVTLTTLTGSSLALDLLLTPNGIQVNNGQR